MADETIRIPEGGQTPETADAPAANPPPAMAEASMLAAADTTAGTIADGADVRPGMMITPDEGEARLAKRIPEFEAFVDGLVKVPLNQGQYDALVDFTYNLGPAALQGSTLLRKLNAGDYAGAAAEFPKWCHAGREVLPGLVTRRARDRAMFEGGTA